MVELLIDRRAKTDNINLLFVKDSISFFFQFIDWLNCRFVCLFVALSPKSTAMVIAGRSVHLTTLFFLGKLEQAVNQ